MLSSSELSKLVAEITGQDENHLYSEISRLPGSSNIRVALQRLRHVVHELESRRIILITAGMSSDKALIETNAPREAIEEWCRKCNEEMENGENTFLDSLKENYYARLLYDSEIEELKYDEVYDLFNYYNE